MQSLPEIYHSNFILARKDAVWAKLLNKTSFIKVSGKTIDGIPVSGGLTPEELEDIDFGEDVIIPDDKKKAAFPIPWGFLVSCIVESRCSKPRI